MSKGKRLSASRKHFYSLARLLDAQPVGLLKDCRHRFLWDHFHASEQLQKLRISPQCYRLLDNAEILPETLQNFYTQYKIPPHPFFPLFLAVKLNWLEKRQLRIEREQRDVLKEMKRLPEHRRRALRILAEYERLHHPQGDNPLWESRLFPQSKKRVREMMQFNEEQWFQTWRRHLIHLSRRYRNIPPLLNKSGKPTFSSRVLAVLVLRCHDINRREITQNFRQLSKKYHPDYGGIAESFQRIKVARDILLGG